MLLVVYCSEILTDSTHVLELCKLLEVYCSEILTDSIHERGLCTLLVVYYSDPQDWLELCPKL